jgi:hypothetical protein
MGTDSIHSHDHIVVVGKPKALEEFGHLKEVKKGNVTKRRRPGFQALHFIFYYFFCGIFEKYSEVPKKFFIGFKESL